MKANYLKIVNEIVKELLDNNKNQSIAHRYDHALRVYKRALKIAKLLKKQGYKINLEILGIAALLHDIDQPYYDKKGHVKKSLKKARKILEKIGYPKEKMEKVLEIISQHSSEVQNLPSSIEAKILFDADKLDGIGALGIARVFAFCGQRGLSIEEAIKWYKSKIKKALPLLQTEIAKKKAEKELRFVYYFIKKIKQEKENLI